MCRFSETDCEAYHDASRVGLHGLPTRLVGIERVAENDGERAEKTYTPGRRPSTDHKASLSKLIDARGLTQAEAAVLFGVTQPRISDLKRGKIALFSIDSLVEMLGHAGVRVLFTTPRRRRVV